MDENKKTDENTNQTNDKFLGWLTKYSDEEKYPKQPTPPSVYVWSIIAGFLGTVIIYLILYLIAKPLERADAMNSGLCLTMFFVLFVSISCAFIALYQCIVRYGLPETANVLPKVILPDAEHAVSAFWRNFEMKA